MPPTSARDDTARIRGIGRISRNLLAFRCEARTKAQGTKIGFAYQMEAHGVRVILPVFKFWLSDCFQTVAGWHAGCVIR
jgi:hypothetical protein